MSPDPHTPEPRGPGSRTEGEGLERLVRFIAQAFEERHQLELFVLKLPGGGELLTLLPGDDASAEKVAYRFVAAATKRGLLDADFFTHLIRARPGRSADINAIRLRLLSVAEPPGVVGSGTLLRSGRYTLEELIGHGGVGSVWRAHDRSTGGTVAIKVLRRDMDDYSVRRWQFIKGATRLAAIDHPRIARVIEPPFSEIGHDFCALRFVPGLSLAKALRQHQIDGLDAVVRILVDIGEGLDAIHPQIFHGDVAPKNIIVGEDGHATLVDFDLAGDVDDLPMTQATGLPGTDPYASPEWRKRSEFVDSRTDIFSLGMTAVYVLYGGANLPAGLNDPRMGGPGKFIAEDLKCHPAIKGVLTRACALEPTLRYATVRQFCTEFQQAARTSAHRATPGVIHVSTDFGGLAGGAAPTRVIPSTTPTPPAPSTMRAPATEPSSSSGVALPSIASSQALPPTPVLADRQRSARSTGVQHPPTVATTPRESPVSIAANSSSLAPPRASSPPPPQRGAASRPSLGPPQASVAGANGPSRIPPQPATPGANRPSLAPLHAGVSGASRPVLAPPQPRALDANNLSPTQPAAPARVPAADLAITRGRTVGARALLVLLLGVAAGFVLLVLLPILRPPQPVVAAPVPASIPADAGLTAEEWQQARTAIHELGLGQSNRAQTALQQIVDDPKRSPRAVAEAQEVLAELLLTRALACRIATSIDADAHEGQLRLRASEDASKAARLLEQLGEARESRSFGRVRALQALLQGNDTAASENGRDIYVLHHSASMWRGQASAPNKEFLAASASLNGPSPVISSLRALALWRSGDVQGAYDRLLGIVTKVPDQIPAAVMYAALRPEVDGQKIAGAEISAPMVDPPRVAASTRGGKGRRNAEVAAVDESTPATPLAPDPLAELERIGNEIGRKCRDPATDAADEIVKLKFSVNERGEIVDVEPAAVSRDTDVAICMAGRLMNTRLAGFTGSFEHDFDF